MSRKKKVEKCLNSMRLTTRHLAHYCKISKLDLEDWMVGKERLPYSTVWNIADFLSLETDDLRM